MVIIKHIDGWSASNKAWIDTKRTPIIVDGVTKSIKSERIVKWENSYTVSGVLSGDVMIAIRDDISGVVLYYNAILQGTTSAIIKGEVDKNFLVTL